MASAKFLLNFLKEVKQNEKTLSIILSLIILCIMLCACDNGNSQTNFLTKSNWKDVGDENETFNWEKVYEISEDWCMMATEESKYLPVNPIHVYMGPKEIIKFNKFDEITIIGILELEPSVYRITSAFVM